nr:hypothetical protein [Tanacetum cinerariifolium]
MSRDMLTVDSTMRIPLLYRGEYSQWSEMFMNFLEEQTDGKAMINSIKNGDQPLPRVIQVSIVRTSSTKQPPLKDKSIWQMLGSEYGKQDRKAVVLYEYETFKANEGELLLDTYIRYLQMINDLKKCGYSKDNYELNFKFLNNLQPEWKQYVTRMRQNKNLMDINIDALYNILKQNQRDVSDAMGLKKKIDVVTSDPLALIAKKTQVSKRKEKFMVLSDSKGSDDELKKITALLAKAFNRKKFYSKPTNNNLRTSSASNSANKKQEYVKYDDKKEDKKVEEKKRDISKVKCYNCKKEKHYAKDCKKAKVKDYEYYKTKMLLAKKDKDEQVLLAEDQAWMESNNLEASSSSADDKIVEVSYYTSESESENHNQLAVDHNDSEETAKLINQMIKEFDKQIVKYQKRLEKANQQNKDFENQNKDLKDKYDVLKNQATTFEEKNNELNEQIKVLIKKNADLLAQTNVLKEKLKVKHVVIDTHVEYLRPALYDERVINLGYTLMFLTHYNEASEIKKFKRARENKIDFAYDYGNLNAYVNEKIHFSDDYFQEIINPDFKKIDSLFQQTSSLKLYVSTVILEKIIIDLEVGVNKNLMNINIDALYKILKQNQGDVNDAMGSKKKTVVVTSDPLALIAEKTNVSRSKEKVVVSSDSKGSEADDFRKTLPSSKLGCVLSQDLLAFCLKTSCVLSQDLLRFVSRLGCVLSQDFLRFVS